VMAEGYFPYLAPDGIINYSSIGTPSFSAVASQLSLPWMFNYNPSQFCAMTNGVAPADLASVESYFLANNIGYLYITDVDYGATDTPTYWSQELAGLNQVP